MYNDLIDSVGFIAKTDKELADAMADELKRQKRNLELIASENIVSPAVMAAMGSVLTNKYAEGYPGKRYYGGCEYVDVVETIAIERAKKLFGANFANVQPHSGAQANTAVYFAATGGAGALLSKCIVASETVCYEDLGTEAVRRLTVKDFPATVVIDCEGTDLYKTAPQQYRTVQEETVK